jgi:tetratricopeptide (TPR) repeat protein
MNETLAYIEAYFQNELNESERMRFEERCITDESFAGDVAIYLTTRQSLKNELLTTKQSQWKESPAIKAVPVVAPVRKMHQQVWVRYAAAAFLILIASLYFLLKTDSPQKLALNYINEHYDHLSQTMGVADTLELGKSAYNKKEYSKAATLFESLSKRHEESAEAKQYAGLSYLKQNDYDQAIQLFDDLGNMSLHSNPGLFLKATALLLRNKNDDFQQSKILLEQVVKEGLEGSEEAKELLRKLK